MTDDTILLITIITIFALIINPKLLLLPFTLASSLIFWTIYGIVTSIRWIKQKLAIEKQSGRELSIDEMQRAMALNFLILLAEPRLLNSQGRKMLGILYELDIFELARLLKQRANPEVEFTLNRLNEIEIPLTPSYVATTLIRVVKGLK